MDTCMESPSCAGFEKVDLTRMYHPRIALFAGPSGGHLFPALVFAEKFRLRYPESRLELVTSRKAEAITAKFPNGIFDKFVYLSEFPSPSGWSLRTLWFLLQLAKAFFISWNFLAPNKPDLSVGFGSYASFPGMLISRWMGVPTLIHEQNFVPGKATRWLVRHADCVALTFAGTFSERSLSKREVLGLPIRSALIEAAKRGKVVRNAEQPATLLIVGGSQGAHGLNSLALDALSDLSHEEKQKIVVIHITGKTDREWAEESYRKQGIRHEVYPFFERMEELYCRSDMAVTRAGANTLFELALFGLAAIVVPYPHAGGHQAENAKYFAGAGAVVMGEEGKIDRHWMSEKLKALLEEKKRSELSIRIKRLAQPQAAERLVDTAEKLLKSKEKLWALSTKI